jgi:hypothetical protein
LQATFSFADSKPAIEHDGGAGGTG